MKLSPAATASSARPRSPASRELGLRARTVVADFSADQGGRACRTLLSSADRPTAIVFDNDIMAVTALGVAAEFGLEVPRDLSLLAWDDSQLCQLTRPTLSAMRHDIHSFGADVTQTLFDVMRHRDPPSHAAEAPVLVPRASTAPPPRDHQDRRPLPPQRWWFRGCPSTYSQRGAQQWHYVAGTGALRNPQSGRCLDVPNSSTTDGTQLQIYDCNGTNAQHWNLPT